jgi:site-specific recombinase XerD
LRSMIEMDIQLPTSSARVSRRQPRLYQDEQQVWQLHYQGEQLKIGRRRGRINEFAVPFPPELVDHLEEYLARFRPLFPKADTTPNLFLNRWGDEFSSRAMWRKLATTVYKHTRKRIYPHLLRTLWTDTYLLESSGDIDTAAFMLNDSPQTVLKHYHELRAERQVPKAYDFNRRILEQPRNGNGKAH